MMKDQVVRNVRLIDGERLIPDGMLHFSEGAVRFVGPAQEARIPERCEVIDGEGNYLAPGFVDLQLNGGYGHDFTEDPGSILEVARRLPETGVTAFLPTFITSPLDAYPAMLRAAAQAMEEQRRMPKPGARILGAHVEGPFLSAVRKGAHLQRHFTDPSPAALAHLQPIEVVRLLTLAPERDGAAAAIRRLAAAGVVVSIGHSDAGPECVRAARNAGAAYATHLYNAMRPMQHRDPGLVGTLLAGDGIICGLIVDGLHVHPEMVKLAYRCLGAERITLVTDAMAAMGMPPGEYGIGGQPVIVDGKTARLENGTLAGSILRMDEAVRNMVRFSGCSPEEAIRMATRTPAEVLGFRHGIGGLQPGMGADFLLLSDDLTLRSAYIHGERVF